MVDLAQKRCEPFDGTQEPLGGEQIDNYLAQLDGWDVIDNELIEKDFMFDDFEDALQFMNQVGEIAEEESHHPNMLLHDYNQVTLSLQSHAIGGLHENDFIVAAKVDQLV